MRALSGVLVALVCLAAAGSAAGWSYAGHREIAKRAAQRMPGEWATFLADHAEMLDLAAVYPDAVKSKMYDIEAPRHFDDADVPHETIDVAVGSANYTLGVVPWAVLNATANLTMALEDLVADENNVTVHDAVYAFGILSHYLADASQPLHATVNYNGQLTNNTGVHSRFESQLLAKNMDVFDALALRNASEIADPYTFTKHNLTLTGLADVPFIMEMDTEAKNVANGSYNAVYYEALCNLTCQLLQDRVQLSVQATMDVWYSSLAASGALSADILSDNGDGPAEDRTVLVVVLCVAGVALVALIVGLGIYWRRHPGRAYRRSYADLDTGGGGGSGKKLPMSKKRSGGTFA